MSGERINLRGVPMSRDELVKHLGDHERSCGSDQGEWVFCPCGVALAMVCERCGQPVVAFVRPGTWCDHVEAIAA